MVTVQVGKDVNIYYATTAGGYTGLMNHKFASGIRIGFASNLSYDVEHNVETYIAPGRRYGWGIKGGAIEVSVNIEGLWVDSGAQQFFANESLKTTALTAFGLGASGTDNGVVFSGCRLTSISVEFDAEGWATQNVEIPALLAI